MSYVKPDVVVDSMIQAGTNKEKLGAKDLFVRGVLSGALLGFATTLALTGTAQTGAAVVGALLFPVGFVMIVLLGLELVTGNFALVPLGVLERRITMANLWLSWSWVFLGNLFGSLLYAWLFAKTLTPAAPLVSSWSRSVKRRRWATPSLAMTGSQRYSSKPSCVIGW
jgi:formate/nitrite transporter FocA (FNT family)